MGDANMSLLSWEKEVDKRILEWRLKLLELVNKPDGPSLQTLKAAIDVQIALADLKVKSRQADWAKLILWSQLWLPLFGVLLGAILGAMLKK
jgi:hypothetical protein